MAKKGNKAVIALGVVVVIIAACYGTYYYWVGRGDEVLFSPTGQWGVGKTPLYTRRDMYKGGRMWIGSNYSFFFVRDVHTDPGVVAKWRSTPPAPSTTPGAPAGGAAGAGRPAGGPAQAPEGGSSQAKSPGRSPG